MAKPKESDKKKVLNTVVLWCCSGFFFILCGYGLYRQHCLEQRVMVLEKQFEEIARTLQGEQPKHQELALRRETRDAGDCVCPAEILQEAVQSSAGVLGNLGEVDNTEANESVRGRKRHRNVDEWKKNIRKRKRNEGQEYINVKGNTVPAKVFMPVLCNCRYKCGEHVPAENQEMIHDVYWKLSSWNAQTTWLCNAVKIVAPKRRKKRLPLQAPSHKNATRQFILCNKRVCKKFFLKVIQISNKRIDYALRNKNAVSGIPENDKRGRKSPPNKISEEKLTWIRDHINSFPKYKSHYGERSSSRQYLSPELSMNKMYELFKVKCESEGKPILKKHIYKNVFTTEFNLHFYVPKTDTCKTCDTLEVAIKAEEDLEKCLVLRTQKDDHLKLANTVRNILNDYKAKVKDDDSLIATTFDLERTLPLPYLNTGEVFYLRQLQILNFGIHSYLKDEEKIIMNMWPEHCGARGSQEVMSSLYHFIEDSVPDNIKTLCLFSDCCSGQNRNWNILHFLMFLVNKSTHLENIVMHYLVSGHTYLPNDTDFSFISREQKKRTDIFTPQAWMDLVRCCRKHKPFIVRDMADKFLDFETLTTQYKDYHTVFGEGAKISQMRKIKFCNGSSIMHFNDDYTENYEMIDLKPNATDLEVFLCNLRNYVPAQARTPKPISYKKMQDIKKILKFVPPVHHPFYLSIPHIPRRGRGEESQDDENTLPSMFGDD